MKTVTLITCDNLPEAYLLKDRLNNEGIQCIVTNEYFSQLLPVYDGMYGNGIQILVRDSDYETARELVLDKLEPEKITKCSYCGSDRIGIRVGKTSRFKLIQVLSSLLAFIPMRSFKPKYYCKWCGRDLE